MGDRELPRARSFTQGPILNSSIRIHLEVSFITVTPGGSPKEGDLCNSALEIEERLFRGMFPVLQGWSEGNSLASDVTSPRAHLHQAMLIFPATPPPPKSCAPGL